MSVRKMVVPLVVLLLVALTIVLTTAQESDTPTPVVESFYKKTVAKSYLLQSVAESPQCPAATRRAPAGYE